MNRGLHDAVKSAAASAADHTARIGGRYVRCTFVNVAGERCFAGQGHTVEHHFQSDYDAMRREEGDNVSGEPLDLAAIKVRAEAATPGPWKTEEPGPYVHTVQAPDPEGRHFRVAGWVGPDDARFIAHARTDVPALVAEVEYLRATVTDLTTMNRSLSADACGPVGELEPF